MTELQILKEHLTKAKTAEAVFGYVANVHWSKEERKAAFKKVYAAIAKTVHPDHNGDSKESQAAFALLNQIRDWAIKQVDLDKYGQFVFLPGKEPIILVGKYKITDPLTAGLVADLHIAEYGSKGKVLAKVVRNYKDNDLLVTEVRNLTAIRKILQGPWLDTVPEVIESILLDEGAVQKKINVITHFEGFMTAKQIHDRFVFGNEFIDGRTIAWMWKRILLMCDWIYKAGYVHGAILPDHVMFFPDNKSKEPRDKRKHSLRLVGWANSIELKSRTRLSIIEPAWRSLYAPEILEKKKLGPSTDMYMGAQTLLYLSRATDPHTLIPKFLKNSLLACVKIDPDKRPKDAKLHFEKLSSALLAEYGPPKWHDFNLP